MATLLVENGAELNPMVYHAPMKFPVAVFPLPKSLLWLGLALYLGVQSWWYDSPVAADEFTERTFKISMIGWLFTYRNRLRYPIGRTRAPELYPSNVWTPTEQFFLLKLYVSRTFPPDRDDIGLVKLFYNVLGKNPATSTVPLAHKEMWKLLVQRYKSQWPDGVRTTKRRLHRDSLMRRAISVADPVAMQALIDLGYDGNANWKTRLWLTPLDEATILSRGGMQSTGGFISSFHQDAMDCYRILSSQPNIRRGLETMAAIHFVGFLFFSQLQH